MAVEPSLAAALPAAGPTAASVAWRSAAALSLMDALQLDFHTTPFRAERFYRLYRPAIPRPLAYGASGYLFYRAEEDPSHFVHLTFWEERRNFDRWWFSEEMQETRRRVAGLHDQPLLPHWNTVIERG